MDHGTASPSLSAVLKLLDDTLDALVRLDSDALLVLEQDASAFTSLPIPFSSEMTRLLLDKKNALGRLLEDTAAILDLLRRLHGQKEAALWER